MERFKGVDDISIESSDMEELLKKNEYLDIRDYIQEVQQKEDERERKKAEAAAKSKRGRGA